MTGIQAHIGSQILEAGPLSETARELAALAGAIAADGFALESLDIGGGIGIGEGSAFARGVRRGRACRRCAGLPCADPDRAGPRDRRDRPARC